MPSWFVSPHSHESLSTPQLQSSLSRSTRANKSSQEESGDLHQVEWPRPGYPPYQIPYPFQSLNYHDEPTPTYTENSRMSPTFQTPRPTSQSSLSYPPPIYVRQTVSYGTHISAFMIFRGLMWFCHSIPQQPFWIIELVSPFCVLKHHRKS